MTVNITSISGEHIYVESGVPVLISGQHVFVESGVHVVADVAVEVSSGLHVMMSGQHFYQEYYCVDAKGAVQPVNRLLADCSGHLLPFVGYCRDIFGTVHPTRLLTDCSGRVSISGNHIFVESGAYVVADVEVDVSSGLHVLISGQHIFIESGAYVNAIIFSSGETAMVVDKTVNAGVIITTPHHEVHKGNQWHSWCISSGLADDANLDMLVVTGSGKEIHMVLDGACGGDSWVELYEGTTVSDNGALITPNCMHRTISGTARTVTYCGPTVTSTMHPLTKQFMTGGQRQQAIGGTIRPNTEWVFDGVSGSINYLVRVLNVAGAAKDASVGVEFYEEDHNP